MKFSLTVTETRVYLAQGLDPVVSKTNQLIAGNDSFTGLIKELQEWKSESGENSLVSFNPHSMYLKLESGIVILECKFEAKDQDELTPKQAQMVEELFI